MAKSDRLARKAARRARKQDKRSARQDKRSFRADTRQTKRSSRRDSRAERQSQRQEARGGRIDARKSVRLAKVTAKSDAGYWSPEAVEARQGTLGSLIETGGGILGGLLGGDMGGGYEDPAMDSGYGDYGLDMGGAEISPAEPEYYPTDPTTGEVVDLYDDMDEEGMNWWMWAGVGSVALGALYWYRMR